MIILFSWSLVVYSYPGPKSRWFLLEMLRRTCSFTFPRFLRSPGCLGLYSHPPCSSITPNPNLFFLPSFLAVDSSETPMITSGPSVQPKGNISSKIYFGRISLTFVGFKNVNVGIAREPIIRWPHIHIYRLEESSIRNITWQFCFVSSTIFLQLPY